MPSDASAATPPIYLDNAATSFPKPEVVYRTMDQFARTSLANPGRSAYLMSQSADRMIDDTRRALNEFFHGEGPERWVFTLNGTDALNMAIKGVLRPGDHVITTDLEHNSVSRPLTRMVREGMITVSRVRSRDGYLDPQAIAAELRPDTRLVAMTHAANALGTVQPIGAVARIVREHGALFLVDAAQSAGVVPIDLKTTEIDLLAFPGHKGLFGPTGTGALYVGPRAEPRPWREGGTGGDSKFPVQPDELPYRLEGGTPNVLGIAGLKAGVEWVRDRGQDALRKHEVGLLQSVVDWVDRSSHGWKVAGAWDADRHVGALSLVVPDANRADPQEIVTILDGSCGIAARGGLHCAPYAHRSVGTFPHGTVRVSPGPFSTMADIDSLLTALDEISAACFP
jgi:cysteine desulfurase family protein